MKIFILFLSLCTLLAAQPLTLAQIQKEFKKTHPFYHQQQEQKALNSSIIKSQYAKNPFILSSSIADAYTDGENNEFEYSVGVSKTFVLGDKREKQIYIKNLQNSAKLLQMQKEMLTFRHKIDRAYHKSCLTKEQRETFEQMVDEFETLYQKKLKAYEYKDISKKELLQLKIEKADLKQRLQSLKANEKISKDAIFNLLKTKDKELSCKDLYPMKFIFKDSNELFNLSKEAYEKELLSLKKSKNLFNRKFETIDLSLGYDNEIDTKKYGLGFSLPLSFTSSENEYKKIAVIHKIKLLKLQKERMLLEKRREFKKLRAKLKNEKEIVLQTKENIDTFKHQLLPLIETSYQLGESSVVEYLLSKQKFWQLQESLSEHKKNYYNTLFDLLTVTEFKDIK